MIFLALLYLYFFSGSWNTLGLPTDPRPSEIPPKTPLQCIFIHEQVQFDSRSIYGILWSCLSTIFACTWITVHPNIPAPGDSRWAVLGRRVAIMGYFLLAPEYIIIWAGRQHFVARYLTKKHRKEHTDWTRAHAFFLIMGGFTLHEGGKPVQVLGAKDLEKLSDVGKIKWPTITKEDIADRSKGDYLSKTIVLFQTTWFVGQCIARWAYGLTVTELEVVTIAFASLIGITYYLWWDKPLDVHCSIPVHLLDSRLRKVEGDNEKEETRTQVICSQRISAEEILERVEIMVVNPNPLPTASVQVDTPTPDPSPTQMQRFRASRRGACEKYGTLLGLGYVFIGFPLKQFLGAFPDMSGCETLGDESLRVPTFYSPHNSGDPQGFTPLASAMCVATFFGAIHCIPWSFQFATLQERWAWRISAIIISGLPISWVPLGRFLQRFIGNENKPTWMKLCHIFLVLNYIVMAFLYITARVALLVLPIMALRALPPGAYVQLNWVSFLPHI